MRVYNKLRGFGEIVTKPYPGFPTDLQPLLVACACSCEGRTIVKETVFESRFRYAAELKKMGANLSVCGDTVEVIGSPLFGARVTAPDLRGGASLCIAALTADGETIIDNIRSIERGYENLDDKFARLGAKFYRK